MPNRLCAAARGYACLLVFLAASVPTGCKRDEDSAPSEPDALVQPPAGPSATSRPEPAIRLDEALPTIAWQDAAAYLDEEVLVVGRIARAGASKTGHVFLNFDREGRDSLTIFIDRSKIDRFPLAPAAMYRGKVVRVHGFVQEYNGRPDISVTGPDDLVVLPDDAAVPEPASQPLTRDATSSPVDALRPSHVKDQPASAPAWTLPADGTITIGAYNVLNLFDHVDDPYRTDTEADEKPRPQIEALACTIRSLNADVLALEEVENRDILQRFVGAFLRDMGYEVVLFEGNDNRGIDVALLSRLPVGPVTSHRHLRFADPDGRTMRFRRDLLQVRVEPPGGMPFDVFVLHLKSKGGEPGGSAETRIGEARAVRAILD
ncbi:MAG: hypothetical protein HY718_08220, partial [Planctomycetes bacterium]|nr:hypothetical protein [Planctomycetota bacterium]